MPWQGRSRFVPGFGTGWRVPPPSEALVPTWVSACSSDNGHQVAGPSGRWWPRQPERDKEHPPPATPGPASPDLATHLQLPGEVWRPRPAVVAQGQAEV